MKMESLPLEEAQRWFEALPPRLQLVGLSPAFAAADARRDDALQSRFLGLRDGERIWLHSTHVRPIPGPAGAWGAISPYGHGGPLSNCDDPEFVAAAQAAHVAWCRAHQVVAEFCRFHPEAQNQGWFWGPVRENRMAVSMDLTHPAFDAQFNTLARRKIARARRAGATDRISRAPEDWRHFVSFYRAAMGQMGAASWYLFTDAYFEEMARLPQACLCICELDGAWASAGLYLVGKRVVEYHLGASSQQGHQAGTAYLMQLAAGHHGKSAGAQALYLGGGISTHPDDSLLFHKKSFSRRLVPFHIGQTIYDEDAYWSRAALAGYDREHPPARILLD